MNKKTRELLEGDALELPHVQELLEEYDRFAKAIGQIRKAIQAANPEWSRGGVRVIHAAQLQSIIQGLTPESERVPELWAVYHKKSNTLSQNYTRQFPTKEEAWQQVENASSSLSPEFKEMHQDCYEARPLNAMSEAELSSPLGSHAADLEITKLEQKLNEANERNDMLEDRLAAEINKFCSRTTERDDWRARALKAESRLESISDAIGGHLDDKGLRSTDS